MKTIADAHKELNGDLENTEILNNNDTLLYWDIKGKYYICAPHEGMFCNVEYICTVEQFNNYKGDGMKTVIDAVNEFKGELAKCNSKVVCNQSTGAISNWLYIEPIGLLATPEWTVLCTREEFDKCVDMLIGDPLKLIIWKESQNINLTSPTPLPTYTKAMANHNILPLVGMECLIMWPSSNYKGTITYMGKGVGCYHSKDNDKEYTFALNAVTFKALTPPIQLIDGAAYQFEMSFGEVRLGFYIKERDSFFECFIGGNKICGKTQASDIQLLEVSKS